MQTVIGLLSDAHISMLYEIGNYFMEMYVMTNMNYIRDIKQEL